MRHEIPSSNKHCSPSCLRSFPFSTPSSQYSALSNFQSHLFLLDIKSAVRKLSFLTSFLKKRSSGSPRNLQKKPMVFHHCEHPFSIPRGFFLFFLCQIFETLTKVTTLFPDLASKFAKLFFSAKPTISLLPIAIYLPHWTSRSLQYRILVDEVGLVTFPLRPVSPNTHAPHF